MFISGGPSTSKFCLQHKREVVPSHVSLKEESFDFTNVAPKLLKLWEAKNRTCSSLQVVVPELTRGEALKWTVRLRLRHDGVVISKTGRAPRREAGVNTTREERHCDWHRKNASP